MDLSLLEREVNAFDLNKYVAVWFPGGARR
jgi:hypothetical protein